MDCKKSILILGYGLSARSAAKVGKELDYNIYIYDDNIKSKDQLDQDLGYRFLYALEDLGAYSYNIVMKSPGIPPDNPILVFLKESGYQVISDIELAYKLIPNKKIIAVSGTNGKTTTTSLINHILQASGLESLVAGNIGYGAVEAFYKNKDAYIVLECSSFQLDDIKDFKPHIAVVTNIESDHLEYHKTQKAYEKAKAKISQNMEEDDYLILNYDDSTSSSYFKNPRAKVVGVSGLGTSGTDYYYKDGVIFKGQGQWLVDTGLVKLRGLHNYYNIMQALAVADILGLDMDRTLEAVKSFEALDHRIEFVRKLAGVSYYNDSKATNIVSTQRAIDSFEENIILILGGYDKGEDFEDLLGPSKDKIHTVICQGANREKIGQAAENLGYENVYIKKDLRSSLDLAKSLGRPGDVILFSPASSSYDAYKNFEERGQDFKNIVLDWE